MATKTIFISLFHPKKLKKITSEQEVKMMEHFLLQSMKNVLLKKNANISKMIFEEEESLHKKEVENEILKKAEKQTSTTLSTPLLLRRKALKIILRSLERKIKQQNISSSASNLLHYVNQLEFKSKGHLTT